MRVRRIGALAAASGIFFLAGCGLFDDPASGNTAAPVVGNPAELEKTRIVVGVLPTLDCAPIHLAVSRQENEFGAEGLNVELKPVANGSEAMSLLQSGTLDIAFASYTPPILAEYSEAGKNKGGIKLVADATSLADRNSEIVVPKGSPLRSVNDLRGKKIAVLSRGTMTYALTAMTLDDHDVPPDQVTWVEMPLPNTQAALETGQVDAAFLTEPLLTRAKAAGMMTLYDTNQGRTEGMPLTGYVATGDWVHANPKTLAAFSRGIQRATTTAAEDTTKVIKILPDYVPGLDENTAQLIGLTKFETSLDPTRLQRVVDLMASTGMIPELTQKDDYWTVDHMVVPPAPLTN